MRARLDRIRWVAIPLLLVFAVAWSDANAEEREDSRRTQVSERRTSEPPVHTKSACEGVRCQRGAFCVEESGKAACIDPCKPSPCLNGASCRGKGAETPVCTCAPGFAGQYCDQNVNDCVPNPCLNDSVCVDMVNGFQCTCAPGYTGSQCATQLQ